MTGSLGFEDSYALGMREDDAVRLNVTRISDLRAHPRLRLGFSEEFLHRGDGWPKLKRRYRLPPDRRETARSRPGLPGACGRDSTPRTSTRRTPKSLTTHLRALADDLGISHLSAVLLYRLDLLRRSPPAGRRCVVSRDASRWTQQRLNARVKLERVSERAVAFHFLATTLRIEGEAAPEGRGRRVGRYVVEHLAWFWRH